MQSNIEVIKYPRLKYRAIISFVCTFLLMLPLILQSPNKILGLVIFSIVVFLAVLVISSLLNIKNNKMKIGFLSLIVFIFLLKTYESYYIAYMPFQKALIVSIVFTAVFALIFRAISIFSENNK
jgi:phosphatidylserine synthase